MGKRTAEKAKQNGNGATLGFEPQLWQTADALRSNMDASEYKHVVLGLIFLKYISDSFEEQHARLDADRAKGADPEDRDEYRSLNIFWLPTGATIRKLRIVQPEGPRQVYVTVAKNYLTEEELRELNRVVSMYLDYAEDQARRRKVMHMGDWANRLDAFLEFNDRNILTHAGRI